MLTTNRIHRVDVLTGLKRLEDESVDCVMTSPPYWATRDYGIRPVKWGDGSESVLGLEPTVEQYVAHLLEVFSEVRRVLKPSGTLWVNLGDTYAGSQPAAERRSVPKKSLCCAPERFLLGMLEQGWVLRNKIIWHKTAYMPTSVKDRFACAWEPLYFFTKDRYYFFDLDAVRVPYRSKIPTKEMSHPYSWRRSPHLRGHRMPPRPGEPHSFHALGRNPGDCWDIAACTTPLLPKSCKTQFSRHPAVFPEKLCERPILAGCPPGGLVLDPFMGSGTTALVAKRLGRNFIGFECNPEFVKLARTRLRFSRSGAPGGRATKRAA